MQFSRIMQRAPARDLSGPKPLGESLTPQSNLTVVDGMDSPSDVAASKAALNSILLSEQRIFGAQSSIARTSASSERIIRGGD